MTDIRNTAPVPLAELEAEVFEPVQRGPFVVVARERESDRFSERTWVDTLEGRRPDGSPPKQYWHSFYNQAVHVFPLDAQDNIYLGEEFVYAEGRYLLEAAGGTPNPKLGENQDEAGFQAAAIRKAKEETGLAVGGLQKINGEDGYGSITSRVYNRTHSYLAHMVEVDETGPQTGDDMKRVIMPFEQAVDYVRSNRISTGVVVAAILRIKDMMEHGEINRNGWSQPTAQQ